MENCDLLRLKILEVTISGFLEKLSSKGNILFTTNNSVIGTADCYFSTEPLVKSLNSEYSTQNGLCYSLNYKDDLIKFRLILNKDALKNDYLFNHLIKFYGSLSDKTIILVEKEICSNLNDYDTMNFELNAFFDNDFLKIDERLNNFINELKNENIDLHEGAPITAELNKYERNREARMKCIEHYGTKCQICGFDFGDLYGKDFDGIIEVHHKKPLCEIKEDYVVDPINDLIPVCPNCHSAIHSKKNGFYTVEELKKIINESKRK